MTVTKLTSFSTEHRERARVEERSMRCFTALVPVSQFQSIGLNKSFPSCCLPLFQTKSWCTTFHMEISLMYKAMNVQVQLIFTRKVVFGTRLKQRQKALITYSYPV